MNTLNILGQVMGLEWYQWLSLVVLIALIAAFFIIRKRQQ